MKKIIPLLLILAILFSGCTSQKDVDNSSDLSNDSTTGESISTTDTDKNIDSSTEDTTSTDNDSVIDGTSEGSAPSGKTPSNNSSSTNKPSSPSNISSSAGTTTNNSSQSSNQAPNNTANQVHLYSYVNGRGWVIQTTYNYNEGDTWAKLIEKTTEISIDTTYDVNFNTVEYLKYNGKAIVLNDIPVKRSDTISNKNIYKLSTIAGPAKIKPTTMYDLINVEHVHDNKSYRSWYVRKYVINETSKTTGTITVSNIEVREYSKPDEEFNGTIIDNDKTSVTYTYTSKYGLYAGKTIELNDGSKILLGNDMYWFYLSGNTKRVLCDDYRAYKKVPNNPNDSYWSYYWSQLN